MIRKKKKLVEPTFNLNELPEQSCSTEFMSRDQLCHFLLMLSTRRKMAETVANKYRTNAKLSQDFSYEEIHGDLVITISQVLNAWEGYWSKKKKIKSKTIGIKINSAKGLRMKTFGEITGYLVNAFKNNVAKKYARFKTDKRAAAKSFVHLDSSTEEHTNNAYEAYISHEPIKDVEYKHTLNSFIKFLRDVDRKENEKQTTSYGTKGNVPMKKQSSLARLFVALLNPRYKGNIDLIRERLNWTDYIFKRNKEILFKKLRNEYQDIGLSMLAHAIDMISSPVSESSDDNEKSSYKIPKKMEIHKIYGMKPDGKNQKYTLTISIDEFKNGSWISVKKIEKKLIVKPNSLSFDEAKKKLESTSQKEFIQAQNLIKKMTA